MESGKTRSISLKRNRNQSINCINREKEKIHSLSALYHKEMSDHITSKRFVIILLLVTATTIAQDGIAVIVNNENPVENLTSDQVKSIFTGETTVWEDVQ